MAFLTSLESILSIVLIILLGYILKEKKKNKILTSKTYNMY